MKASEAKRAFGYISRHREKNRGRGIMNLHCKIQKGACSLKSHIIYTISSEFTTTSRVIMSQNFPQKKKKKLQLLSLSSIHI